MSWEDTIRKKGSRSVSTTAIEYVDLVMSDNKTRTVREVIEDLFEMKKDKTHTNFKNKIPTTRELEYYFQNDAKYERVGRNKFTNQIQYQKVNQ